MKANQNNNTSHSNQNKITSHHNHVDEALKESEDIMRYIVRHDPNAIAIYDCHLHYIAVSERYLHDYNVKEEDIIGKHHYEVFPEMPQKWKDVHQRCLAGAIENNEDDCFERPDGSITYNRWECRPWRRMNGEIGGIITYTEVISERKKAEKALMESEEKYRFLFANNPQPMLIYDVETLVFLEVNQAAVNHYGYTSEEFLSMTLKDIRPRQDVDTLLKYVEHSQEIYSHSSEWRHKKKNGNIIHVEITSHPITFNDRKARHVMINDITDRKRAEEQLLLANQRFALHIEHSPLAFIEFDLQGMVQGWNPSAVEIFGFTAQQAIGQHWTFIAPQENRRSIESVWEALVKQRGGSRSSNDNITRNGRRINCEWYNTPLVDTNGKALGVTSLVMDVTERKLAEQELIVAKENAEESDRLKSAFLANMSHEVRTPLNSIIGFSELLADPDFEEKQKNEFIHQIITNGDHLLTIISDILDISKLESGEMKINFHPMNALQFISGIEKQFFPRAEEKKLELKISFSDTDQETIIFADADRLRQIFNNLVENAFKFTSKGTIEMGYQSKGQMVEFYVRDTGIGIAAEYHDKIFDRFRQVEGAKTRTYAGNGLGLTISKNLVELMGGRIWVESEPGIGSAFYFTIPAIEG